jgi:hypothetical protein
MRSMMEGRRGVGCAGAPSTALSAVPLPVPGRIFQAAIAESRSGATSAPASRRNAT